jgi:hypothetical protein
MRRLAVCFQMKTKWNQLAQGGEKGRRIQIF